MMNSEARMDSVVHGLNHQNNNVSRSNTNAVNRSQHSATLPASMSADGTNATLTTSEVKISTTVLVRSHRNHHNHRHSPSSHFDTTRTTPPLRHTLSAPGSRRSGCRATPWTTCACCTSATRRALTARP
eukprot:m.186896 g.186896  ORF g.186896 m.186896 type:complete len:129 (+) comp17512_c0_seq2:1063-1449(+)